MRFAAFRAPWYKGYLAGGSLLMAGDVAEHAMTYWAMWQYFHSPLLAGFAVVSHWLPHLFFSIPFGALADKYDCRRIIQVGLGMFMLASLIWGILLVTRSLQPWECVLLLLLHGFASAVWKQPDSLMIYDMVGRDAVPSGVRLMSTGVSLGAFIGPAFGAGMLFLVGPAIGMFINIALYVPFLVYLMIVPVDGHRTTQGSRDPMTLRGVLGVLREVPKYPSILVIMILQGAVGLFIGSALMPLFPEFGSLLGVPSGFGYGMLLVAMSFGAIVGGVSLEAIGRIRASTRLAITSALVFALGCLAFAFSRSFVLSLIVLAVAGLANLVTDSTSATVVQLAAPADRRGRFLGASSMTALGSRAGSGILLGVLGGIIGVAGAVAVDAGALALVAAALLVVVLALRRGRSIDPNATVTLDEAEPAEETRLAEQT